jgi:hypothetical protein
MKMGSEQITQMEEKNIRLFTVICSDPIFTNWERV